MRKIKFRAWDKQNKNMEKVDLLGSNVLHIKNSEWENTEDFEVMQYTGLKDDNSLEIFEGDIIKENGWDGIFYLIIEKGCKFIAKKIGDHNGDIFTKRDIDLDAVLWPVIVGNEYDNPELLDEVIKRDIMLE